MKQNLFSYQCSFLAFVTLFLLGFFGLNKNVLVKLLSSVFPFTFLVWLLENLQLPTWPVFAAHVFLLRSSASLCPCSCDPSLQLLGPKAASVADLCHHAALHISPRLSENTANSITCPELVVYIPLPEKRKPQMNTPTCSSPLLLLPVTSSVGPTPQEPQLYSFISILPHFILIFIIFLSEL